jgi:hypothetical protein
MRTKTKDKRAAPVTEIEIRRCEKQHSASRESKLTHAHGPRGPPHEAANGERSDLNISRFLTAVQVRQRYGHKSEMWLERMLKKDPKFPGFIRVGRARLWDIRALEQYEKHLASIESERRAHRK